MYTDLKRKIKQQRRHLFSTLNFLNQQIKLENEIKGFVQSSEEKLNHALQFENISFAHINSLRERLADDQRLLTESSTLIHEFQIEITSKKTTIAKSKLKLQQLFFPAQKHNDHFKQNNKTCHVVNLSFKPAPLSP